MCAQSVSGGSTQPPFKEEQISALIVKDVKVQTIIKRVEVPEYVKKEQTQYVTKEQSQVKYNTVDKDTTRYNIKEAPTTRFVVNEEKTTKYMPEEVAIEKPVIVEKKYTIATYEDANALQAILGLVKNLTEEIGTLRTQLNSIRGYKLVEEIIKVPKLLMIPTEVERVVWKDVPRERCQHCSKEI